MTSGLSRIDVENREMRKTLESFNRDIDGWLCVRSINKQIRSIFESFREEIDSWFYVYYNGKFEDMEHKNKEISKRLRQFRDEIRVCLIVEEINNKNLLNTLNGFLVEIDSWL